MKTCINCCTNHTPQWRNGYCNACATYYYRHGVHKDVTEIYAKILLSLKNPKVRF